MHRKHVTIFGGIIIGELIEKIVTLEISDVCNLLIFQKLMPIENKGYYILISLGPPEEFSFPDFFSIPKNNLVFKIFLLVHR